jgi:predicted nicotinamide N-methyase
LSDLREQTLGIGGVELSLLRPCEPEALLDEEAFAQDEFMPYWAELWPAGLALAHALPERLERVKIVELGAGLGVPSLVAAARGGEVTAIDWAPDSVDLLARNAARNGLELTAVHADWRAYSGSFALVLAADLLYERRNVEPLLALLPRLAPEVLLAEPGRPYAEEFFDRVRAGWGVDEIAARVYRLTRADPARRQARADA